jgi:D-alanyl-D-alanine carboxypeptidase/Putative peptidoglycan binding domain
MNISGSVGQGGRNTRQDVLLVQQLLTKAGFTLTADGICGPKTLAAILLYQRQFLAKPDGRIDPNGATWKRLIDGKGVGATVPAKPNVPCVSPEWGGDSSKWPQDKKLASMETTLRSKVPVVLNTLRNQGFKPKIFFAWRSVAVQQKLLAEGRTTVSFSFHNAQLPDGTPYSYAADIIDERWGWDEAAEHNGFWKALGAAAKQVGLVWGGDWKSFPDVAHVQSAPNSDLAKVKKESGL